MSKPIATRSEFEASMRERYRADTLKLLTPKWQYACLLLAFLGAQAAILAVVRAPALAISLAVLILLTCATLVRRMSQHDREIRARASMTPVYDMTALRGQVDVLHTAINFLQGSAHLGDKAKLRQAVAATFSALKPLLARGPTRIETATVAGYPAYPAVETASMPGAGNDFISLHLLRIEASYERLCRAATADGALAETVSHIAGEFVPPLRSIEAQLA